MAKAWEDSPYLFIVKVQPLLRGAEEEDVVAEQFGFTFTSTARFPSELREELRRLPDLSPLFFFFFCPLQ